MTYEQTALLAMELDRSHVGGLVQIITETWSMTGTLTRVDQHDNREWDIDYANGHRLVPRAGEIYAELWIGPWTGRVIGNQPVTVERAKGTLEAPERAALRASNLHAIRQESAAPLFPEEGAVTHVPVPNKGVTRCGLDWWSGGVVLALEPNVATCPECWRHAPVNKLGWTVPEDVALGTPEARVLEGTVVDAEAVDVAKLEGEVRRGERTVNSARAAMGFPPLGDLPPAPPEWPDLPSD